MAHVTTWTVEDVAAWVDQCLHLPYGGIFMEASIDGTQLLQLGSEHLWELGIEDATHRTRLLSHAEALRVAQQQRGGVEAEAAEQAKLTADSSMGSTGGTCTEQPLVLLRPDEEKDEQAVAQQEEQEELQPPSLAAAAVGGRSISSPNIIVGGSSCSAACDTSAPAPRFLRSGIPINPVVLSQYPRVGSPTCAPVTPKGVGRRRAAPAAAVPAAVVPAASAPAASMVLPGPNAAAPAPGSGGQTSSPQPRAKSQQRRSRGSSSGPGGRQSIGGPCPANNLVTEVLLEEDALPCSSLPMPIIGSSNAIFKSIAEAESEVLPTSSQAAARKVVPGLALGTSRGSASLSASSTTAGGISSSAASGCCLQAPCSSPRLASPRCSADSTPTFTPRTGQETVSRCSSAPTYRSRRGPSLVAAEGASLFLADQSKGAHFGGAIRNLEKCPTTPGPGPAGYNVFGKTAKKAIQADRSPGGKFDLDPRRTMESMHLRGEAGPGAGKYNPPPRRNSRGGSIPRAARWGVKGEHANGSKDRGGMPKPHEVHGPGPMTYRPNFSALSTVK